LRSALRCQSYASAPGSFRVPAVMAVAISSKAASLPSFTVKATFRLTVCFMILKSSAPDYSGTPGSNAAKKLCAPSNRSDNSSAEATAIELPARLPRLRFFVDAVAKEAILNGCNLFFLTGHWIGRARVYFADKPPSGRRHLFRAFAARPRGPGSKSLKRRQGR